jgi:FtsH-binding integral membrane protein
MSKVGYTSQNKKQKMKKIQNILAIALLLISSVVMVQQKSAYTFYRQHMNLVNPVYIEMESSSVGTGWFCL